MGPRIARPRRADAGGTIDPMIRPSRAQWMLRWDYAVEIALGALTVYVALRCMLYESTMETRLFWMALACCFLSATIGVWFARQWARWAFGLIAAIAAVSLGVQSVMLLTSATDEGSPLAFGLVGVLWGVVAHRMLRPSTGRQFGSAREALARARESSA